MALAAALNFGPAAGAPADLFQIAAPVIGADPPRGKDLHVGDASVSTQTGNLSYSYPISVPPGRHVQPKLSLNYSSSAPIYGGIAAGWSLGGVPAVYEDVSAGRLTTRHPYIEMSQTSDVRMQDDRFASSLVGGQRLVLVNELPLPADVWGAYRAKNDGTYTRFQLSALTAALRETPHQ